MVTARGAAMNSGPPGHHIHLGPPVFWAGGLGVEVVGWIGSPSVQITFR